MTFPGLPSTLAATLLGSHSLRVRIDVLDLAMSPTGQSLSPALLAGQVNVDADAEVTRSFTSSYLDAERQLAFDSNSPADGALYADRMLRVWYDVRSPLGQWVEVPVFTGPVVKFSRDGAAVDIECQGKESLARSSAWRTLSFEKNELKSDVILKVMRALGERHFGFESTKERLPGPRSLTREEDAWAFCQSLARSMGMQLFYDGFGRLILRHPPTRSAWTFATGTGGSVVTQPKVAFDISNMRNAVEVVGDKPKGAKAKVRESAVAPANHPLSPFRLGRNGAGLYRPVFIDDSSISSSRDAKKLAERELAKLLVQHVTVELDALVVPQLDAGDVVTVQTSEFAMQARLSKFSVTLTAAGTMSVGYHRKIGRPSRAAVRSRR